MKKSFSALAFAAALGTSVPASATGIPTIDAASVAQLQQQLLQMMEQYETLKQQYAAITGTYGRGQIGLEESIKSASVVPGSWQEVVAQQRSGAFGSKQNYYEELIKTMPQDLFRNPEGQGASTYKLSTDSVRAAMAGGDALYAEVQTHLNNLARLSQHVDATTNIKDAQDLQNRIATENGLLQTSLAKVSTLNMNLQANLVNQQNQATAANQNYYKWDR
jgi:type IV secretion system protein VirB5